MDDDRKATGLVPEPLLAMGDLVRVGKEAKRVEGVLHGLAQVAVSTPIRTETAPRDTTATSNMASKARTPGSVSGNVNASPTTSPR